MVYLLSDSDSSEEEEKKKSTVKKEKVMMMKKEKKTKDMVSSSAGGGGLKKQRGGEVRRARIIHTDKNKKGPRVGTAVPSTTTTPRVGSHGLPIPTLHIRYGTYVGTFVVLDPDADLHTYCMRFRI